MSDTKQGKLLARLSKPNSRRGEQPAGIAPREARPLRTALVLLLGIAALFGIGLASSILLAPPSEESPQQAEQREKPSQQQASELTAQQMERLEDPAGAEEVAPDLIGLSDTDAISEITDERWGAAPFSTSVISRAVTEGYPIAADRSGIVKDTVEEDRGGSIVRGDIRIVDDAGIEQGILPFVFDKEASSLLFDPIEKG